MSALTLFGYSVVGTSLVCYAFEDKHHLFTLGFALTCLLGSVYGFLQGAAPFGSVEIIWTIVGLVKWHRVRHAGAKAKLAIASGVTDPALVEAA